MHIFKWENVAFVKMSRWSNWKHLIKGNILAEDGKCNFEIWRCTGIVKHAFQNLSKAQLETMTRVLNCYVISVCICLWILDNLFTDEEPWGKNVFLQKDAEHNHEPTMWAMKEKDTYNQREMTKFLGLDEERGLESLTLTGHPESKRWGKQ